MMLPELCGSAGKIYARQGATKQDETTAVLVNTPFPRRVQHLREELNVFIEESEAEFLALGNCLSKLSKLSSSAAGALEMCIAVTGAGTSGTAEHEQLKLTFQSLQALVESTHRDTETFSDAARLMDQLASRQEQLKHTLSALSFVGLSFSMESLRKLPSNQCDGFAQIRSEIAALQARVVCIVDEQQRNLTSVREDFGRCMDEARKNQKRLGDQLCRRWEQLEQHLEEAAGAPPEVRSLQSDLSAALADIMPILSTLVSTLQGHDAIRQRLMHIMDTLEQIAEAQETHRSTEDFSCFLREASSVLHRQVDDIGQSLSRLIDNIRGGFEQLAYSVSQLASLALSKGGPGMDIAKTSGETIRHEILDVHKLLGESLLHNGQLQKSSSPVQSLADAYSRLIAEVRCLITELSLVIKIAAINAQIYAAHSGNCGALRVLGREARHIADTSIRHSTAISEHFQALSSKIQRFRGKLNTADAEHRAQQQNLTDCFGTLTNTLENSKRQTAQSLQELRSTSIGLHEQTTDRINSLHFLDRGLRLIENISLVLEEFGAGTDLKSYPVLSGDLIRILEVMRSRYTMERERALHSGLTRTDSTKTDNLSFEAVEKPADEVDNFELF